MRDFFNYLIALDITDYPLANSITNKLQQRFTYSALAKSGITLNGAAVNLERVSATYEFSEYLAVPLGMPLLVFNYLAYQGDRQPVVCGKTLSRSDWTCYTAEVEVASPGLPG